MKVQTSRIAFLFLIAAVSVFSVAPAFAQETLCTNAEKFCADAPVTFTAGTSGSAEGGNNYGCLADQPAPAWFYFEVGTTGTIDLLFNNSNNRDIDFAIWGPYDDYNASMNDCGTLGPPEGATTGAPIDCSYSSGSTETASIDATAGEVYVMLITNYSEQPTDISVSQSGGTGSISCSGVQGVSSFEIDDVSVTEGDSGTTTATFTISRDDNTGEATVTAATADNTATTSNGDYDSAGPTVLSFSASGGYSQTFSVTVNGDTASEADETFYVNLSNATGNGVINDSQGIGTITNDDSDPSVTLSVDNSSIAENGGVATITATLDGTSASDVTVNLSYSGTAAGSGTDYTASSTSIVVSSGTLTGTATVTADADTIYEGNETVVVDISSVTNGNEDGTQQISTTIVDDDSQPSVSLSVDNASIAEDGGVATLTATLSNESVWFAPLKWCQVL